MDEKIFCLELDNLNTHSFYLHHPALSKLEAGLVVYLPNYPFNTESYEQCLLNPKVLSPKFKNISYDFTTERLAGYQIHQELLLHFMQRFTRFAKNLVEKLLPTYQSRLQWGRTSYRPIEISGRVTSKRKDDTRLHVDSFSATPVHGLRILRVFSNINPLNKSRIWNLGNLFRRY